MHATQKPLLPSATSVVTEQFLQKMRTMSRACRTVPRCRPVPASLAPLGPLAPYKDLVQRGRLRADSSQHSAVHILQEFASAVSVSPASPSAGVYIWGSVGSGKTMLMDLFADSCAEPCTRLHFHELMLDVHGKLHTLQAARPRRIVFTKLGLPVYKYDDPSDDAPASSHAAGGDVSGGSASNETAPARPKASPPLEHVIGELASSTSVLCLDEMQVTDVADAMLLRQLFEGLFDRGVRVLFTSNRPPEELYERGLNRKYFLPFVSLLRERCHVLHVGSGEHAIDYRTLPPPELPSADARGSPPLPYASRRVLATRPRGAFLSGPDANAALRELWEGEVAAAGAAALDDAGMASSSSESGDRSGSIPVAFGRSLSVRDRVGGACWFTFDELCGRPAGAPALGAADYLALASSMQSVYLSSVPVLSASRRNEARRFVVLIDALYEARVRLLVAAAAPRDAVVAPLLATEGTDSGAALAEGAEIDVSRVDAPPQASSKAPSFAEAPVGGRFRVDGELAAFFTAKDERFMMRRTLSRLVEMTETGAA